MRPVNRGDRPTHSNGQLKTYDNYGSLRQDLIARIGEYCSYCETPLGANLAIEHMLSKVFSINEVDWNNSLLACTNCNSHKKDKTLNENDLDNYYWPSVIYAASFNTFDMLQYTKANVTLQSLIDNGVLTLPQARARKAYVQASYNMVWVGVNPAYVGRQQEAKIKATINLTGLNDYVPTSFEPKASDRRITNRTIAWDRAVLAAANLNKYYVNYNIAYTHQTGNLTAQQGVIANANADASIILLKKQIQYLAVATGFWSVWVTVFKDPSRTFINDTVRNSLICELFGPTKFAGTRPPFAGIAGC